MLKLTLTDEILSQEWHRIKENNYPRSDHLCMEWQLHQVLFFKLWTWAEQN